MKQTKATQFSSLAVMLDASRNGVPTVDFLKRFIDTLQKLGYNELQLYTEDTYTIMSEPYFGRLRGRYSNDEIKQIDAYAKTKGIELVPCIQTLAHLNTLFKWPHYKKYNDCNDILLVDFEPTYELIDKMFSSCADSFSSRKINIGMDEAIMLGLGRYLSNNGYQKRYDIMLKHLKRVKEIADKYGFKLLMWSDMFFRLLNDGDYFIEKGKEFSFSSNVKDEIPSGIDLVYWDYALREPSEHSNMFKKHAVLSDRVIFAGGATKWMGLAPFNRFSINAAKTAFEAMKESKVNDVIVTMWGDDSSECPIMSMLPVLAYYSMYNTTGKTDIGELSAYMKKKLNLNLDDYLLLDKLNELWGDPQVGDVFNPSKYMLYNDPLLGMTDYYEKEEYRATFKSLEQELKKAAAKNKDNKYLFNSFSKLAAFLESRVNLTNRIIKAYKEKSSLSEFLPQISLAIKKLDEFVFAFDMSWHSEYKPFGKEVLDIRFGGLKERYKILEKKVKLYSKNKISSIAELEEERLPIDTDSQKFYSHFYNNIVSPAAGLYPLI